jgi:hypothetical protein
MFRKGSPLVEPFNRIIAERQSRINRLLDMQLGQKCTNHFFPEQAIAQAGYTPLTWQAMLGAFGLWFAIIMVAVIAILCELIYFSTIKRLDSDGANLKICFLPALNFHFFSGFH